MKQLRNTRQRQMILDTVRTHLDHPSADEIYLEVREKEPKISRGTVYRNLKILAEHGEIRQIKMPDADRFDWRQEDHYHLRCANCAKIMDVPIAYHKQWDQALAEQTGYQINGHRMVFEGICPDCLKSKE